MATNDNNEHNRIVKLINRYTDKNDKIAIKQLNAMFKPHYTYDIGEYVHNLYSISIERNNSLWEVYNNDTLAHIGIYRTMLDSMIAIYELYNPFDNPIASLSIMSTSYQFDSIDKIEIIRDTKIQLKNTGKNKGKLSINYGSKPDYSNSITLDYYGDYTTQRYSSIGNRLLVNSNSNLTSTNAINNTVYKRKINRIVYNPLFNFTFVNYAIKQYISILHTIDRHYMKAQLWQYKSNYKPVYSWCEFMPLHRGLHDNIHIQLCDIEQLGLLKKSLRFKLFGDIELQLQTKEKFEEIDKIYNPKNKRNRAVNNTKIQLLFKSEKTGISLVKIKGKKASYALPKNKSLPKNLVKKIALLQCDSDTRKKVQNAIEKWQYESEKTEYKLGNTGYILSIVTI